MRLCGFCTLASPHTYSFVQLGCGKIQKKCIFYVLIKKLLIDLSWIFLDDDPNGSCRFFCPHGLSSENPGWHSQLLIS